MIIAIDETGVVRLHDSPEEIPREYEAIDVESGVFAFYDESGHPLVPEFSRPNRRLLFGFLIEPGEYSLRAATEHDDTEPLPLALFEATSLEPSRHVQSLDELRARFPFRGGG